MSARYRTTGAIFGLGVAALMLATPAVGLGAGDCASATKGLEQAQQALSKALRDADTLGEAYGACMAKGGGCSSQKSAYDSACANRKKAKAALTAAASERKAICTPD